MAYDIPTWSIEVAQGLMAKIKAKDLDTFDHCVRVSRLSKLLAQASGLNDSDVRIVEYAGLFHDIGKVGVPDEILLKPSKLTHEEYEVMKSHPELSVEMLRPLSHLDFFAKTLPGVLYHHERFDGRGYPEGVSGESIPLASRIILVVDTYDAMTWSRPYRKGLSPEVAYKELIDFAGRQFDPKLVEIFNHAHPKWRVRDEKQFQEVNNGILAGLSPSPVVHSKDRATDVA
jgi:putative nucleotidyltransferase with HDIG domain